MVFAKCRSFLLRPQYVKWCTSAWWEPKLNIWEHSKYDQHAHISRNGNSLKLVLCHIRRQWFCHGSKSTHGSKSPRFTSYSVFTEGISKGGLLQFGSFKKSLRLMKQLPFPEWRLGFPSEIVLSEASGRLSEDADVRSLSETQLTASFEDKIGTDFSGKKTTHYNVTHVKLSALETLHVGNPPVTGGFLSQRTINVKLWYFFVVSLKIVEQTVQLPVIWYTVRKMQWVNRK